MKAALISLLMLSAGLAAEDAHPNNTGTHHRRKAKIINTIVKKHNDSSKDNSKVTPVVIGLNEPTMKQEGSDKVVTVDYIPEVNVDSKSNLEHVSEQAVTPSVLYIPLNKSNILTNYSIGMKGNETNYRSKNRLSRRKNNNAPLVYISNGAFLRKTLDAEESLKENITLNDTIKSEGESDKNKSGGTIVQSEDNNWNARDGYSANMMETRKKLLHLLIKYFSNMMQDDVENRLRNTNDSASKMKTKFTNYYGTDNVNDEQLKSVPNVPNLDDTDDLMQNEGNRNKIAIGNSYKSKFDYNDNSSNVELSDNERVNKENESINTTLQEATNGEPKHDIIFLDSGSNWNVTQSTDKLITDKDPVLIYEINHNNVKNKTRNHGSTDQQRRHFVQNPLIASEFNEPTAATNQDYLIPQETTFNPYKSIVFEDTKLPDKSITDNIYGHVKTPLPTYVNPKNIKDGFKELYYNAGNTISNYASNGETSEKFKGSILNNPDVFETYTGNKQDNLASKYPIFYLDKAKLIENGIPDLQYLDNMMVSTKDVKNVIPYFYTDNIEDETKETASNEGIKHFETTPKYEINNVDFVGNNVDENSDSMFSKLILPIKNNIVEHPRYWHKFDNRRNCKSILKLKVKISIQ